MICLTMACSGGRTGPPAEPPVPPTRACTSDPAPLAAARADMAAGNLHVALAAAETAVTACASPAALLVRADILADLGLDERALADYTTVSRSTDDTAAKAATAAITALRARPSARREPTPAERDDALAFYRGGVNYRLQGKHAESLALLRKSYALLPHPLTVVQIGLTHQAAGNEVDARRAFARAVALAELTRGGPLLPAPVGGHTRGIVAVAFSPDGSRLVSTGGDLQARLWEVASGRELRTLSHAANGALAYRPDGKVVATASQTEDAIKLWDPQTGALVATLELGDVEQKPIALSWSADGARLAAAAPEDDWIATLTVAAPDLPTVTRSIWPSGHDPSVALSGGAPLALAASSEIRLVSAGARPVALGRRGEPIRLLAASPDGATLAVVTERAAELWDLAARRLLLKVGHAGITAIAWSADGGQIASAGGDGQIRIWDRAGALTATMRGHLGAVRALAFAPDGRSLASGGEDTTIRLWSLEGGGELRRFGGLLERFTAVTACGPGRLATGSDRGIRIWDLAGGTGSRVLAQGAVEPRTLSCSADGARLIQATAAAVWSWRTDTGAALGSVTAPRAAVAAARIAPAGDRVAILDRDGFLVMRELDSGRELWRRATHIGLAPHVEAYSASGAVSYKADGALAFSADGAALATTGTDDTVKLWDASSGRKQRLLVAAGGGYNSVLIAGDAVVAGGSGTWQWQIGKPGAGRELSTMSGPLALSADGRVLAGARYSTVQAVDAATGKELGSARPGGDVVDLAAGDVLATVGSDRTLRLWAVRDAAPVAVIVGGPGNDWLAIGADGRIDGSPGAQGGRALLSWQRGDAQLPGFAAWDRQHAPGLLAAVTGRPGAVLTAKPPGPPEDAEQRGRVVVTDTDISVLEQLLFAPGAAELDDRADVVADAMAGLLMNNTSIELVELGGHTDAGESSRTDAHGLQLSERRAAAVRAHLIAAGVAAERLTLQGYGDTAPLDRKRTPAARARNRRVTPLILKRSSD